METPSTNIGTPHGQPESPPPIDLDEDCISIWDGIPPQEMSELETYVDDSSEVETLEAEDPKGPQNTPEPQTLEDPFKKIIPQPVANTKDTRIPPAQARYFPRPYPSAIIDLTPTHSFNTIIPLIQIRPVYLYPSPVLQRKPVRTPMPIPWTQVVVFNTLGILPLNSGPRWNSQKRFGEGGKNGRNRHKPY